MTWNDSLIKDFVHYYNTVGGDIDEILDEYRRLKGITTHPMHDVDNNGNIVKEMTVDEIAVRMVVPDAVIQRLVSKEYSDDFIIGFEADYKLEAAQALHSIIYKK